MVLTNKMLIDFTFKNYSSFLNITDLSLEADSINEFDNTIAEDRLKLLPVAAIFGPNESGKSNLIKAFQFMQKKVTDSNFRKVKPFYFTSESENSCFSIEILISRHKVANYSFSVVCS